MTKELFEIVDTEASSVFIKMAFYKTFKDKGNTGFARSKETLDKIRAEVNRGRSQYKSYITS